MPFNQNNFMQPEITDSQEWWSLHGAAGTIFFPGELSQNDVEDAYEMNGSIWEINRVIGYGARMSAPGYMDCTDWSVFDTQEEAEKYLEENYGDDTDAD